MSNYRDRKRKAFGQHFLKDHRLALSITEKAVTEAIRTECKELLEIGPGRGALTIPLVELLSRQPYAPKVILIEKDRELASEWKKKSENVTVKEADFLDLPESEWMIQTPLAVLSNLPYSSGTAILTRLAQYPEQIQVMVLMFQAEVAQRIRAEAGTKSWGSLSLWVQNRWDVNRLHTVPPGAFSPPPEVMSEVIILHPRKVPRLKMTVGAEYEKRWENLLKTSFSHRRKMLRSTFKGKTLFENALEQSGVDGTKRAEALEWDEWQRLYNALD